MNDVWKQLYQVVQDRKASPQEGSYTCYLFDKGLDKILKKVGEECAETIIAAKNGRQEETVGEISDLIYHLTVMMAQQNIPLEAVLEELDRRSHKIGSPHAGSWCRSDSDSCSDSFFLSGAAAPLFGTM